MRKTAILFLLAFLFIFAVHAGLAEKIKIKIEKGIPVVYNPKKPDPPPGLEGKLFLVEELRIGEKEKEGYMFAQAPDGISLAVDSEGNIYTLDPKLVEIRRFNPEGKLLMLFGKKGKGPEEMDRPRSIRITAQDELMFIDTGNRRITFYNLDGEFLRFIPTHKWSLGKIKLDSKGNVVTDLTHFTGDKETSLIVNYEIKQFNQKMEPLNTFIAVDRTEEFTKREYEHGWRYYWQLAQDDSLIFAYNQDYEFHIITPEGKIIRKFKKDYDPVKVTQEEETEVPQMIRDRYKMPTHHSGFHYFTVDDEGRLYVRTWERTKDGDERVWDVFDAEGKWLAQFSTNDIVKLGLKGKLYTAGETEEGISVVKRYNMIFK